MKRTRKLGIVFAIVAMGLLTVQGDTLPQIERKKFEVTFTVTYNAITLQEAAVLEGTFRRQYQDACKVDVSVKEAEVGGNCIIYGSSDIITLEGATTLENVITLNDGTIFVQ